jgi:hypothetical protein
MGIMELPPSCNIQTPSYIKVRMCECFTGDESTAHNVYRINPVEKVTNTLFEGRPVYYTKKCNYCEKDAKMLDVWVPVLNKYTACEDHAKELFNVIIEE